MLLGSFVVMPLTGLDGLARSAWLIARRSGNATPLAPT